jgi:hypothetical protein
LLLPSQRALTLAHRSSDHCSFFQIQSMALAKASVGSLFDSSVKPSRSHRHRVAPQRSRSCAATPPILPFHIADDGLPPVVDVNMLDKDKLLPADTQPSKDPYLRCIGPHWTSSCRSRTPQLASDAKPKPKGSKNGHPTVTDFRRVGPTGRHRSAEHRTLSPQAGHRSRCGETADAASPSRQGRGQIGRTQAFDWSAASLGHSRQCVGRRSLSFSFVSASIQPPRIRRHGNTRACGRPRVSKTASSRLRSKGAVDIGCHSMYGMVCGRQLPVLDLNHETRGGSPICVSLPSQKQVRLQ